MIKEILNRNLTLLSKDIKSYVNRYGFENVLKEAISLDRVDVVKGLNKLRAVSITELFPASTANAQKVAKWLVEEKKQMLICVVIFLRTLL
ncbi:MAG TPA: hypothetical protein LFW20_03810 [Rickettsia endosymbiont of Omalisus fontisbellaquei]|nr:hypothetical protein [Rickettsia endosymbiont of Omalisus fontisbellaquei]